MLSVRTLDFKPFPLLRGAHAQTIVGAKPAWTSEPPAFVKRVELPDGDSLALVVATPPKWKPSSPTVLTVHGLGGCHRSHYNIRLAAKLYARGIRSVRMNLRGCGAGAGWARKLYHGGSSDDVLAAVDALQEMAPESPITLIGYSLGGNMALKLAGELGEAAAQRLQRVIAVCPPVDLAVCSKRCSRPANRIYERYFVKLLVDAVRERLVIFPDMEPIDFPRRLSLQGFDDMFTAPRSGFAGALDYYAHASSLPLIPKIRVQTHVLFAADDPLIDTELLDEVDKDPRVVVTQTTHGGHLGFIGHPRAPGGLRWLDAQLLAWVTSPAE